MTCHCGGTVEWVVDGKYNSRHPYYLTGDEVPRDDERTIERRCQRCGLLYTTDREFTQSFEKLKRLWVIRHKPSGMVGYDFESEADALKALETYKDSADCEVVLKKEEAK